MRQIVFAVALAAGLLSSPAVGQVFWRASHPALKANCDYEYVALAARGRSIVIATRVYNSTTRTWTLSFLRSTDCGIHWSEVESGFPPVSQSYRFQYNVISMQFIDDANIVAASDSGYVLRSSDTATTWVSRRVVPGGHLNAMHFEGPSEGIVVSGSKPYIHFTTNAGVDWLAADISMAGWAMSARAFGSGAFSVFSYGYGSIYRTRNAWDTFDTTLPLAPQSDLSHVPIRCAWRSADSIFAFGTIVARDSSPTKLPFMARSTNGGIAWDTIFTGLKGLQVIQVITDVGRDTILLSGLGSAEYAVSYDHGRTWSGDSVMTDTSFNIDVCRQLCMLGDGRPVALWEIGSAPGSDVGIFVGEWQRSDVAVYEYYIRSTQYFPNPASSHIKIQSVVPAGAITVRDVLGRDVAETVLDGSAKAQIDVSGMPAGVYCLVLKTGSLSLPIGKVAVVGR